eukprot:8831779-Pyramimonas_sp.AAC.1
MNAALLELIPAAVRSATRRARARQQQGQYATSSERGRKAIAAAGPRSTGSLTTAARDLEGASAAWIQEDTAPPAPGK